LSKSPGVESGFVNLRHLSEDALLERIESLVGAGAANAALMSSLDELFRRIREEAEPGERDYVEMTIARLKSTLTQRDDDEPGPAGTGVREPRRPAPEAGSVAAAVELPRWCDEAA
jgi:hypothetical protein